MTPRRGGSIGVLGITRRLYYGATRVEHGSKISYVCWPPNVSKQFALAVAVDDVAGGMVVDDLQQRGGDEDATDDEEGPLQTSR